MNTVIIIMIIAVIIITNLSEIIVTEM